jgi:ribose 1,5-bisphosphate isomerase
MTQDIVKDIKDVKIQGAKNVALHGLTAFSDAAETIDANSKKYYLDKLRKLSRSIALTRPTEPNLRNALSFVLHRTSEHGPEDVKSLKKFVRLEIKEFSKNIEKTIKIIGETGARRIENDYNVFTHCHSNTVMSILKEAKKTKSFSVTCTETRPLHQGYLTAKELSDMKIPTTLIIDSAARTFIKKCDIVLLGADAIASNGAVINKIGSSMIALAAHEHHKPVYVAAGIYKIDPMTIKGFLEPIEERAPDEIIDPKKLKGVIIRNPAFDVIPPEYIDGIITERGIIPPASVYELASKEFSWMMNQKSWWI